MLVELIIRMGCLMKKFLQMACAVFALAAATPNSANAAQVTVDVDIDLPQLLLLYCYSTVSVVVPGAALASIIGSAATTTIVGGGPDAEDGDATILGTITKSATSVGGTTLDVNLDADALTDGGGLSTATLNLNNVCAVRGLAGGNVSISVGNTGLAKLIGPGVGNEISVTSYTPSPTSTAISLGTLVPIDVAMGLDLSSINAPGKFAMTGGGNKMIVSAALP